MKKSVLSTEPYKGVRDFFPADMAAERKIFDIWRKTVEKYGYEEYGASVLEPAELYRAKSGEELVNEQTYTFTDRGDRQVTLRPEMTPTVARMVSAKRRELSFPLRWYSIPNLFRYEQPQRGRLREHWQLNVDIFGVESINAEIEIISIAHDIVCAYGLKENDFEIRINNRKLMNYLFKEVFGLNEEATKKMSRLIDKKNKISKEDFEKGVREVFDNLTITSPRPLGESSSPLVSQAKIGGLLPPVGAANGELSDKLLSLLNSQTLEELSSQLPKNVGENEGIKEIQNVIQNLEKLGITNVRFDQSLMRGFDYYTGIVFEIFDQNPVNKRSVFGGGRYDDLLSIFGGDKIPAVGFGAGDVAARDLMETYGNISETDSSADLYICTIGKQNISYALKLAQKLRQNETRVTVDFSEKKVGDQIASAVKYGIPKVICIGDEEVKTTKFKIKTLETGQEVTVQEEELIKSLL